jgi:hypothetical protein
MVNSVIANDACCCSPIPSIESPRGLKSRSRPRVPIATERKVLTLPSALSHQPAVRHGAPLLLAWALSLLTPAAFIVASGIHSLLTHQRIKSQHA